MVRASASQSVDLEFILLLETYQKTLKNGIHSFPARRSSFKEYCKERAGKFVDCVFGQVTGKDALSFMWKTDCPDTMKIATSKPVRTFRPKDSNTILLLVNEG